MPEAPPPIPIHLPQPRHASVPSAVELNPDVQALLRAKGDRLDVLQVSANRFLQKLSDHLGGPAIFVLDTTGKVIASSDWIFSNNLLGADLSYMPVLREAGPLRVGKPYLALSRLLPGSAWRIVVVSDLRPVAVQAYTHAARGGSQPSLRKDHSVSHRLK